MAGERRGLVADALHHAAVTGDDERVVVLGVVAEAGAQVALGDRHADRVAEPLAERTGRDLDAGGVPGLGMAGRRRLPLAEAGAGRRVRGRSRTGTASCTAGSTRGRWTGRTGRGRASAGRPGRERITRLNSTWASGASAIAVPWWPLLAASGASIAMPRVRRDELGILFGGQRHAEDSTRRSVAAELRHRPAPTVSRGRQQRERDDHPRAAVDAAVGEHRAVVVELEFAAHEPVGELARLDA